VQSAVPGACNLEYEDMQTRLALPQNTDVGGQWHESQPVIPVLLAAPHSVLCMNLVMGYARLGHRAASSCHYYHGLVM
jgi:hypothetical protein